MEVESMEGASEGIVLLKAGARDRVRRRLLQIMLSLGVLIFFVRVPSAVKANSEADEAAAARHAYSEKIAAKYNFRYGKEFPFLPSNATTDNGEFIDG
jgi:hypothetical protein